jgi:D-amino-acid dehydrogenase
MNQPAVTVIGGGVIGLATAYQIALDGTKVTLVDSGEPRFGTSNQNAGWVAPSHVIPFAAPGMVSMGVEQLLKRTGAFGFSPTAGPLLASWTMKFMRSCTEEHVSNSVPALTELLNNSIGKSESILKNLSIPTQQNGFIGFFQNTLPVNIVKSIYERKDLSILIFPKVKTLTSSFVLK